MLGSPIIPCPILLAQSSLPNPSQNPASRQILILLPAHLVIYTSILMEYLCCPPITVHHILPCPPQLNHPVEVNPFPPPNPPRLSPLSPFSCHHLPFVLAHGILRTMARTISLNILPWTLSAFFVSSKKSIYAIV